MRTKNALAAACLAATLALTAACSQEAGHEEGASAEVAADMAPTSAREAVEMEAAGESAPGLTTTAAPGVAFAYQYAFSLPGDAISDVQHRHAAACEELGAEQCQITGLDYRQDGPDSVTARLDFLVAPGIANRFGKDALDEVKNADGTLEDATVSGENVGGQIENSQVRSAGLEAELARIEKRLTMPGLSSQEKESLAFRAEELRRDLQHQQQVRAEGETRLATVPMNFTYSSHGLFAASDNPLGKAASSSLDSMESMLAVVLTLLGIALPWFLLAGLLFLAWKGLRRTLRPAAPTGSTPAP
ncbi:MAG: DUF4349 domain-containing protein [Sphingomonadaceae bacterium]